MPRVARSGSEEGTGRTFTLRADLEPALRALPTGPGVYLFRDERGKVLYVGKAANLRQRVRSYFRPGSGDQRWAAEMIRRRAVHVETILTDTEAEALLLENTLIKEHAPRYNVRLRDDKSYLFLRLRLDDPFPWVERVRRPRDDGNPTFGPFASGMAAKETQRLLHEVFPLRTCSNAKFRYRSRPCLDHQIGRCPAPCVGKISPEAYAELVEGARRFLAGDRSALLRELEAQMRAAAKELRFEEAARYRDRIRALEATAERQRMVRFGRESADYWGWRLAEDGTLETLVVLRVVGGEVIGSDRYAGKGEAEEALVDALVQYYDPNLRPIPERVYLPIEPRDRATVETILAQRRGKAVRLLVPRRGDPRRLLELACRNAATAAAGGVGDARAELQRRLGLPRPPVEIECYDVSVHQGHEPVGVRVVFVDGQEVVARRRRYRLTPGAGRGDVQWLVEMLERRLRRGLAEDDLPDLIVLDGGRAQLAAVVRLARRLELEWQRLPIVALAKARNLAAGGRSDERIFLPGRKNPVVLRPGSPAYRLVVALRDATHAAAVRYHRVVGRNELLAGIEAVPGVGPRRRRALLAAFPDLRTLAMLPPDEVAARAGIPRRVAAAVVASVRRLQSPDESATIDSEPGEAE